MWRRTAISAAILSLGLTATAVSAADKPTTVPKDTCTGRRPPPADMASWANPETLPAARSEAGLAKSPLTPGKAIIAKLLPVGEIDYRAPPERAEGPATFGGLYALKITSHGTYRIASSAAPWIDVFADKIPADAGQFGHGPDCTGIGKMVDFTLKPGDYLVQISESLKPDPEIMVAPVTAQSVTPQR